MKNFIFSLLIITLMPLTHATTMVITASPVKQNCPPINNLALKWYRDSAEKIAIYHEVFNLSKLIIKANKAYMVKPGTTCGVIFDIDDTLLSSDNYQYANLMQGLTYNHKTWANFVISQKAEATPGAVDITNFIHSLGCKVNLVSNRLANTQAMTEANLRKQGIYFDQVLLSKNLNDRDKNPRFLAIINGNFPSLIKHKQTIIAYYGDNIQDFPHSWQSQYTKQQLNSSLYNQFGTLYFILPNPMYGSWLTNKIN